MAKEREGRRVIRGKKCCQRRNKHPQSEERTPETEEALEGVEEAENKGSGGRISDRREREGRGIIRVKKCNQRGKKP